MIQRRLGSDGPEVGPTRLRRDELRGLLRAGGGRRGDPDDPPRPRRGDHPHRHGRGLRRRAQRGDGRARDRRAPRRGGARDQVEPRRRRLPARAPSRRASRRLGGQPRRRLLPAPRRRGGADRGVGRRHGPPGGARAWCATSGSPRPGPRPSGAPTRCTRSPPSRASTRCSTASPSATSSRSLRELGIAYVAYSPLSRGLLTGRIRTRRRPGARRLAPPGAALPGRQPRAQPRPWSAGLAEIADGARRRPGDRSPLAWLLAQGDDIVPLVGTSRADHVERQPRGARPGRSRADDLAAIDEVAPVGAAAGDRYPDSYMPRLGL